MPGPLIPRDPDAPKRTRDALDRIRLYLNSLIRKGRLVQVDDGDVDILVGDSLNAVLGSRVFNSKTALSVASGLNDLNRWKIAAIARVFSPKVSMGVIG